MLTEFWNEQSRKDIRTRIFRSLHEVITETLIYIMRIASRHKFATSERDKPIHAKVQDQFAAVLFVRSPMADAGQTTTIAGKSWVEDTTPLNIAQQGQTRVQNLDYASLNCPTLLL